MFTSCKWERFSQGYEKMSNLMTKVNHEGARVTPSLKALAVFTISLFLASWDLEENDTELLVQP